MENSMQTEEIIYCAIETLDGILVPSPKGAIEVILEKVDNEDGEGLSGRLSWGGRVQAFLTYDTTGTQILGFTLTDMSVYSHLTEQSVANILQAI